jgi:hypothetical protein
MAPIVPAVSPFVKRGCVSSLLEYQRKALTKGFVVDAAALASAEEKVVEEEWRVRVCVRHTTMEP